MTKEIEITLEDLREIIANLDDGTVIKIDFGGDSDGK